MNAQKFLEWMKSPGFTAREEGAQLDALLDSFPYFQSGHLLYIKNLHNQGSFLYNNQLKTAAAYAVNRKVLYDLITLQSKVVPSPFDSTSTTLSTGAQDDKRPKPEHAASELSKVEQTTKVEEQDSAPPKFPAKRFVNNPDDWEAGMLRQLQLLHHWKKTSLDSTSAPLSTGARDDKAPQEKHTEPEKEISVEKVPDAKDEINTLLYVLVEPGESEDFIEEVEETDSKNFVSEESSDDTKWQVVSQENSNVHSEQPIVLSGDSVEQEILVEAIHSTFSLEVDDTIPSIEELKSSQIQKTVVEEVVIQEKKADEEVVVAGFELSFSQWLKQVNTTIPSSLPKTALTTDQLIEKFLKYEPRIQVKKSCFFNPVNMAKKSVQDTDEFITETLARIYAKQGNHSKAIRAYQKLSLKFPEKTAYFAALIEELKRTPDKPSQK